MLLACVTLGTGCVITATRTLFLTSVGFGNRVSDNEILQRIITSDKAFNEPAFIQMVQRSFNLRLLLLFHILFCLIRPSFNAENDRIKAKWKSCQALHLQKMLFSG